ncbi:MAG: nucleotidyltransferase domain-containing protein [Bacteroidota bacterium]
MDKGINHTVRKFVDMAAEQQPGLISAFIFGSYAKNKQHTDSDIDVALVIDNLTDSDRFDTQVRLMLLASQIDNRIEPHPISKQDFISDNPFMVEILRSGIELKI